MWAEDVVEREGKGRARLSLVGPLTEVALMMVHAVLQGLSGLCWRGCRGIFGGE